MGAAPVASYLGGVLAGGRGPHHTVLSTAIDTDMLEMFAAISRTELVVIDAGTTPRTFANQLRWNNAHYRLSVS